jgi:DNA-binding LacI/PurR family transcriptional regulator
LSHLTPDHFEGNQNCDRSQPPEETVAVAAAPVDAAPVEGVEPPAPADRSSSVSIRDVARSAGVSYQTVSRVINDSPNVSVAARTAVQEAIERLGFRPNRAARALAGGPVQSVTVFASNTTLYGYSAALEGIEEATREVGFQMGVRVVEEREETSRAAVEHALEPGSAVIVIAFDRAGAQALTWVPGGVPTVAMIQAPTALAPSRPSVWLDETTAAKRATAYLLSLGHETVHHLPIPSWPRATPRMEGWRAALEESGVVPPTPCNPGWTAQWGYEIGRELAETPEVTALLCGNDDMALGVLRAMQEAGRDVPGDISIVGFDDIPAARYLSPSLTTVRQDFKALGKVAFAHLLELSSSTRRMPAIATPIAELIIRESTGPPPGGRTGRTQAAQ